MGSTPFNLSRASSKTLSVVAQSIQPSVTDTPYCSHEPRLERAIGVIYRPETERLSHYFQARLTEQFDAVLHFDQTRAVEPLEPGVAWKKGEAPETFPSGL